MKMTMERLCQLIQLQPEIIKKLEVTASRMDFAQIECDLQVPPDTEHKNLPSVTRLQKKARELLLNGGKIGSAYGIMGRWPALTPQSS